MTFLPIAAWETEWGPSRCIGGRHAGHDCTADPGVTLAPFLRTLEEAGQSATDLGAPIGITTEMLGDPRAIAPADWIYRFTQTAAREPEEPHLGVELDLNPEITRWPVIAEAFSTSHVVVQSLARFLLDAQKSSTNVAFRLELEAEVSWIERDRGFEPREMPAQIDALSVGFRHAVSRRPWRRLTGVGHAVQDLRP